MKDSLMQHCTSAFLDNLGGLIFKIFWHAASNHSGASFATNPQRRPPLFKIPASTPVGYI